MSRAQAEIDLVWGNRAHPDFEQVAKLRYVHRVMDEALRLWSTVPGFARQAREAAHCQTPGLHPRTATSISVSQEFLSQRHEDRN